MIIIFGHFLLRIIKVVKILFYHIFTQDSKHDQNIIHSIFLLRLVKLSYLLRIVIYNQIINTKIDHELKIWSKSLHSQ